MTNYIEPSMYNQHVFAYMIHLEKQGDLINANKIDQLLDDDIEILDNDLDCLYNKYNYLLEQYDALKNEGADVFELFEITSEIEILCTYLDIACPF